MTEDLAILTALNWWTNKLRDGLSELQLTKFREKLAELIHSEIVLDLTMGYDGAHVGIYCSDRPCELLSYAAVYAGISESIFPHHVDMRIESYDDGEHYEVLVLDGWRKSYKGLYPINTYRK